MEKISAIISKNVLSLSSGNKLGYIIDVVFDKEVHSVLGIIVVDEESEQNFFVDICNVKSYSEECCMISDDGDMQILLEEETFNPIGKDVFDGKGVHLGKVTDVFVDGNHVKKILTNRCEFPVKYLKVSDGQCLIFGLKNKKNNKKNNFKISENLNNVFIQKNIFKNEEINKNNNFEKIFKPIESKGEKPIKIIFNSNDLIGRKINKDLFGFNNEIIAKKNSIITKKIIEKAKQHNKFNLLLFYLDRQN